MKVLGLVTEYNPFHNGHKYHVEESKAATGSDYTVCVMSGNFIQRGNPALLNKWSRTKMALLNGVDLVIELPVCYALQSAEHFAYGAVKILDSLHIVDSLCFGSEHGKVDFLHEIASVLVNEPDEVSVRIQSFMNKGYSFAQAREEALITYMSKTNNAETIKSILTSPNNILGIEYIKALQRLNSNIKAYTIQRHKAAYHSIEPHDKIASATAIRNILQNSNDVQLIRHYVPDKSYEVLMEEIKYGRAPVFSQYYDTMIISLLRRLNSRQISVFPDVSEGLENRIFKASHSYGCLEKILSEIKTKRYTLTRLQRIMFNVLLNITQETFSQFQQFGGPQYIRVLGMNNKGKELLKLCRNKASLPIIIKPSYYNKSCNSLFKQMIELDFLASDLYNLGYPNPSMRVGNTDLTTSPVII